MSLATRCPHCNTLFKVTSGQLQLHQGQVRCGGCQGVFSGIDHLTAADSDAWQNLSIQQAKPQGDPNTTNTPTTDFLNTKPEKAPLWRKPMREASPVLRAIAILLLTGIVLQTAWWKRTDLIQTAGLSATIGQTPWLQSAFALPATRALAVEGSGLQALDENTLRIDLTLRNTSALPSQWPHLKIELLDSQGLPLATRTLAPQDYQQRDSVAASQARPIPARKTVEVLAYLNLKKLNEQLPESAATGFRLTLYDTGPQQP